MRHTSSNSPPPNTRSSIVKVRYESGAAMRQRLFIMIRAIQEDVETDFRRVWGAPERPPNQAFRRRRLQQVSELLQQRLPPRPQVRCDLAAGDINCEGKVLLQESVSGNMIASPLYESIAELRRLPWQPMNTRHRD